MQVALRFSKTYTHTVSFPPLAVRKYLNPSPPLNLSLYTDRRTLRKVQDVTADGGVRPGGTHSFRPTGGRPSVAHLCVGLTFPSPLGAHGNCHNSPEGKPKTPSHTRQNCAPKDKGEIRQQIRPHAFPKLPGGLRGPRVKFKVRAENSWTGQA